MKILCVSDTISPIVYSSQIRDRFRDVDMVISAGDLPMEYLGFISSSLNKPVLFVFGNHNLRRLDDFKKKRSDSSDFYAPGSETQTFGSTYIDNRVAHVKGLLVGGLGGSIRYNKGENQFTEFQMFRKILGMVPGMLLHKLVHGRYIDVLVTHASPLGIHDKDDLCHKGFKCFRWFMRAFKPKLLLHGHIHLYEQNALRQTTYHATRVINVYDHFILTVGERAEILHATELA